MDDLTGPQSDLPPPTNEPEPLPPDPGEASQSLPERTVRRPRMLDDDLRYIGRLLYSHNPFYCISAFLVLWGLGRSFHFEGSMPRPELLMSGLAGYALLLAAVGCLLIRAGQLWEDIRTILLLIVVIFQAISMSFDEVLSTNLAVGRLYYLGGLAFAIVLSELVLRGVRLRLPPLYRLPYYATLALLFLYPLLLGPWQAQENDPHIRWLLAGFSPIAGLVTLTLLPAVCQGPDYVRDNGSPWQWPWYPWPLFVVLGVGVGLRCYALCVSFHPSHGPATMFEPYFLVPWLFGVIVVLLEIGLCTKRRSLVGWMMAAPAALLLLSTWTFIVPNVIGLRPMLRESIGCTPLFLTLIATTLLYTVCLLRRVSHAFGWLNAAVVLLVVIGPTPVGFNEPYSFQAWPLVMLALLQLGAAVRYRSGAHSMTAAVCAIAAACIVWPQALAMRWGGAIPVHLLLLAMLLIGVVLRDWAARFLQRAAIAGMLLVSVIVMTGEAEKWTRAPHLLLMIYPGVMLLLAAAYGALLRNRRYLAGSLSILLVWGVGLGYRSARPTVAGLDQIAAGMACLLVGLLVSLWKLGIPQAWIDRWLKPPPAVVVMPNGAEKSDRGGGMP
jgi:hypothetical protein